jgi:hypothetical protein
MRRRDRIPSQGNRAKTAIAGLLLLLLLSGCDSWSSPTPAPTSAPPAETILPAGREVACVLPDRRRLFFYSGDNLVLLDVMTRQELLTLPSLARLRWVGDELVYGEKPAHPASERYVISLSLPAVVRLETLPAAGTALARYVRTAGSIYAMETGDNEYTLLLLQRDSAGDVLGGYSIADVHNLVVLLSGVPYQVSPSTPFPNVPGERYSSPDGQYYYLHQHRDRQPDVLEVYSQQGELLNSVTAQEPYPVLTCYGWTWDGRGVYFQSADPAGVVDGPRFGPFQVLKVEP